MTIDVGTIEFLEKLNEDQGLQSGLQSAVEGADDKTGAAVAFAQQHGFSVERAGFDEARAALKTISGALSDEQLEGVAGGFNPQPEPPARVTDLSRTIRLGNLLAW